MKYTRIYADAAGESHLEDVAPEMKASDHSSIMSEMIAAKGVIFRETNGAQYFVDWHNAPRRQFVVNLSGEVEITVSDGQRGASVRAQFCWLKMSPAKAISRAEWEIPSA
jgi:hypothetical protein